MHGKEERAYEAWILNWLDSQSLTLVHSSLRISPVDAQLMDSHQVIHTYTVRVLILNTRLHHSDVRTCGLPDLSQSTACLDAELKRLTITNHLLFVAILHRRLVWPRPVTVT